MKKLILIALTTVSVFQARAQINLMPEVGLNFASMHITTGGNKLETKSIIGYKLGSLVNIVITDGFYLEPGAFYSIKGVESFLPGIKEKTSFEYLEIPLNLGYRYDLGDYGAVFATAGPYVGLAMKGKTKIDNSIAVVENEIKFGSKEDEVKKLDYGANFSLGYISPVGIYIRAQYGVGKADLRNEPNTSGQNRVWGISLGYDFGFNER